MKKAVILAGGSGTRLYPITKTVSKQLLPVGNKPLIYYPLSLAMLAGIDEILIISQADTIKQYKLLFKNGEDLGIDIKYKEQVKPEGLAQGVNLSKSFVGSDDFLFLLGDNIVHGHGLPERIIKSFEKNGSTMFSYYVENPTAYGVLNVEKDNKIVKFVEKPLKPESNWASIGIYVFKNNIFDYYDNLKRSRRGEYELPDLVSLYMKENNAYTEKLGRGYAWFDAGTMENFQMANSYINIIESSTNKKIGCLEEISYFNKWKTKEELIKIVDGHKGDYYEYIRRILNDKE